MPVRVWPRPPWQLVALFAAVILVPAATLAWLANRTLEQDRALERQAVRDRLDHAAAIIASDVGQRLDNLVARLPALASDSAAALPAGAVLVSIGRDAVTARPADRILYYPRVPVAPAPASDPRLRAAFARAESLEFRDNDLSGAAGAFRGLAANARPAERAAALVGLARCLRKSGRRDAALAVYDDLARVDARVDGDPAALVALDARLALLVEMKRAEAPEQARALLSDLDRGRWMLDRASYEQYRQETASWVPPGNRRDPDPTAIAMSDALADLDRRRPWNVPRSAEGRAALWMNGRPLVAVWRAAGDDDAVALLLPGSWLGQSAPLGDRLNVKTAFADTEGHLVLGNPATLARPLVVRQTSETGLPWILHLASANPALDAAAFSSRRQLVAGIVIFVAVLVLGVAAIVLRSLSRDMAVRRTQAEFVATVSHEFRSPLTSMSHLIEMLESGDVVSEDKRRRYYDVLGRETRRLRRLVENLLDFRRMEVGRVEYRREPIDACDLARGVADDFATELGARDRVALSLDGTRAPVSGDAEALARALWNLLDNAAKYSPPGSPIRLELGVDGPFVAISVSDEGAGIPAADQEKIFRPFYRGAVATASGIKGTGIGLATVAQIIRAHGGEVRVVSEPGQGSTFTIVLPVTDESGLRTERASVVAER